MKKCSKTVHHSVTELNITPLLDLAFVLLVIFIITTIPPVKNTDLKLPQALKQLKNPPRKANYISVQSDGSLSLDRIPMVDANDLLNQLKDRREKDNDLNIIVRGDGHAPYKIIRSVLDVCQQAGVLKVDLATEPLK
jgi:biopolymer transport protein ExbD